VVWIIEVLYTKRSRKVFIELPNAIADSVGLEEIYLDNELNLNFEKSISVFANLPSLRLLSLNHED